MNWHALRFDWTQIRAFLATAEEGSLSGAARALGLTQPTLGRQVTALEDRLGVTLFERAGRNLRLTQAGRDLMHAAKEVRDATMRFSLAAEGQNQAIEGSVSITATDFVASRALPRIIAQLKQIAPGLDLRLISSNAVQDLTMREADISIRHARPEQPDLIARLIGEGRAHLYAAPSYLDTVGRPTTLQDLEHVEFIGFDDAERMIPVLASFGLPIQSKNVRIESNSGAVIGELVKQGLGYTILTEHMARHVGGVERVLESELVVPVPVWLVTHRELHTARRIRLVFDHLAEHLPRSDSFA